MKKNVLNFQIGTSTLQDSHEKSYEIVFEVYNNLQMCENILVKEYFHEISNDEFYESLKYHFDVFYSILNTKKFHLIDNFFIWKYSYCYKRKIDVDYFLIEYDFWKQSYTKYLYPSQSFEINMIYDYIINNHAYYKECSLNFEDTSINVKHKELFNKLLNCLLTSQRDEFYNLIVENLTTFNNDIFLFIKDIVNPLMYKIGLMWQFNEISVAKEHLATSIIDEVINDFLKKDLILESSIQNKPIALVSTVGKESHILPIKILTKFLQTKNYQVRNISSKLSNKELVNFIYELEPKLIVLSITLPSNIVSLKKLVKSLKDDEGFLGTIIVGGQALFNNEELIQIDGADFVARSLDDLDNYLKIKKI